MCILDKDPLILVFQSTKGKLLIYRLGKKFFLENGTKCKKGAKCGKRRGPKWKKKAKLGTQKNRSESIGNNLERRQESNFAVET